MGCRNLHKGVWSRKALESPIGDLQTPRLLATDSCGEISSANGIVQAGKSCGLGLQVP